MKTSNHHAGSERARRSSRLLGRAAAIGAVATGILGAVHPTAHAEPRASDALTITPIPGPIHLDPFVLKNTLGDYDGDRKTDRAVWRPSAATWYVLNSSGAARQDVQWGVLDDIPVSGDFDGDLKTDRAVWRPSNATWYVINSSGAARQDVQWGVTGDIPVPGDYDGDGKTDRAVWRTDTATWYVLNSSGAARQDVQWGVAGDIPVPGDYDGDGKTDRAVFRPSNATWYVINSSGAARQDVQWGVNGDIPVAGDYDGDNKADRAVFRPSNATWYVINSSGAARQDVQWGIAGDIPEPGDYDGDGKIDRAVFRPSTATWFVINSSGAARQDIQWGVNGDIPLPNAPDAEQELGVPLDPQQQSNWCWAATTQMIAAYSGVSVSQCVEANYNTGRTDCCTSSASASDATLCNKGGWWLLSYYGFNVTDVWQLSCSSDTSCTSTGNAALTFDQLTEEFEANRPVAFAWHWTSGGGHALTAIGARTTNTNGTIQQWVTVNNPDAPNVGDQSDVLYTTWVSASDHAHWRDTYNIVKP